MNNELQYKKIIDLVDYKFCIPSYQRGYRWDDNNIRKFIEDIYENKSLLIRRLLKSRVINVEEESIREYFDGEAEYSIQTLIVKKENDIWNVIDGQQRLTTIYIMIAVLNSYNTYKPDSYKLSIKYQSRNMSKEFLEFLLKSRIKNRSCDIWNEFKEENTEVEKNIDFDYMENAFKISHQCFEEILEKNDIEKNEESFKCLLYILLYCNKFIWYPMENVDKDEREQFAKINMGKIELTDAELIKAEFMNPNNYKQENIEYVKIRQTTIAESWYSIENELHKSDFWAFIPHPNQYEETDKYKTRIDILFYFLHLENWVEKNKEKSIDEYIKENEIKINQEHFLFYEVKKWIEEEQKNSANTDEIIENCWERVENIFQNLKELYEDDGRHFEWKTNKYNCVNNETEGEGLYNLIAFLTYVYNCRIDNKFIDISKDINIDNSMVKALKIYFEVYKLLKEERSNRVNIIKRKIKEIVFLNGVGEEENISSIIKKMEFKGMYNDKIPIVLLLYNIILLNKSTGIGNRYNFLRHAREKWSREHIFPQKAKEFVKDRMERKGLLEVITNGVVNEGIVIKKSLVLNYINYKYNQDRKYCPIDKLKNKGIIGFNEKTVEDFLEKRNQTGIDKEKRNEWYKVEYARNVYLIKKSIKILEMYDVLEKKEKNLNENMLKFVSEEVANDKKVDYIFNNKTIILDYNEDILFSNIMGVEKEEVDESIHKYLIEKQMKNFFEILNEKFGNTIRSQYEKINIEIEQYYKDSYKDGIESNDDIKENQHQRECAIIEDIKELIKELYNYKINKIIIYNDDIKNKVYRSLVEGKLEEVIEIINNEQFSKLNSNNNIDTIIKKINIDKKDSSFLDLVIKISCDTITERIDDFFKNEYVQLLNDNSMGNMTLLDVKTNGDSNVGNKPYNIKKDKIYDKMKDGVFIPLSTILVFTDLYTGDVGMRIHWLPGSRLKYLKDLVDTICIFFGDKSRKEK